MKLEAIYQYRKRTYPHLVVWMAAGFIGACAVGYAKIVAIAQDYYFKRFAEHPYLVAICAPVFFLIATGLVRNFAPQAKGSGIPQVLEAIDLADSGEEAVWGSSLVSLKTAFVKVISTVFGILGGASIGREGPTVQLASSIFAWMGKTFRKYVPDINPQTFLTAGAAAGVAAAFNTPLAGISFAIEEIAEHSFALFKETVLITVVFAGIMAQFIAGDYLYFGHPTTLKMGWLIMPQAVILGIVGGILGGVFARLISGISVIKLPGHWATRTLVCGVICGGMILITHGDSAGSGYEVTRRAMESNSHEFPSLIFPIIKLIVTVLSYLSGMAGGIFSPCLSIGSSLGFSVGQILHYDDLKICGLLGMVAFFSSAVRAPLTAVLIVMEMTDEHSLIMPFIIAAFIAQAFGKLLMPIPPLPLFSRKKTVLAEPFCFSTDPTIRLAGKRGSKAFRTFSESSRLTLRSNPPEVCGSRVSHFSAALK